MTAPRTVVDGLARHLSERPDGVAFRSVDGDVWTWREYAERAARFAGGLQRLGVRPGDRVVLMLRNRLEFHVADVGALLVGATPISIYNSSSPEQIHYLASHCEAVVAITEDGELADRMLEAAADVDSLRDVVVVGDAPAGATAYDAVAAADPVDFAAALEAIDPTSLITVIYTSGTTGPPKGVMLDHTNLLASFEGWIAYQSEDASQERLVSYLPMAHIAERQMTHYLHLLSGSQVTPCADMNELSRYLVAIRPTVLFGPPRVWEKLAAGMQAAVGMRSEEEQARFGEALVIGRQVQLLRAEGVEPTGELAEKWHSVDEQLFRPLRAMVGLDECKVVFGGAAPVPPDVIDFLRDVGLPMSEIWGMSEGTGGMTWDPVRNKSGKVGRAYPGLELKLADDGEVLCRGAIVFKGYLNDPERTREALDEEGWLHTGDIGELDDEGYLRIVDRKKELIITAGGKNVSPANIENTLKTVPLVGQVMAIGDAKPYLVALVTLDADACGVTYPGRSLAELASDTAVRVQVAAGIAAANQRLSRVEQVRRFVLLGEEWLPDSDLLTPTMKLKRRGVVARYAAEIDSLYAGGGVVVPDRQEQLATSAS